MNYEAVIGLEVHVQIRTRSKMFSPVETGFGREPNTLTDPVVLALPGALPVMNKAALDAVIKAGLMLGCRIAPVCKWDRKNYFYPDSPKNYQISQYDQPICLGGQVEIELPGPARNVMGEHKTIPLTRIHLEEDVGKLNHFAGESLVDYNRAGTPLMEIVSDPALRSADEAYAFLTSLRATMVQGGISDCDMEKGQMRCDANISIRPVGESRLGTKVELKNLNSIAFVRDGIAHEIKRQMAVMERGGVIVQETRDYDGQTGASQSLRSKEMAHDYRYFPDPDLMPVRVDEEWLSRIRRDLPEMPFDRQRRFFTEYQLPYTSTSVLIWDPELSRFFEETARISGQPAMAANWIINGLLREMGAAGVGLAHCRIGPSQMAELVTLLAGGKLTGPAAKDVFTEVFRTGDRPEEVVRRLGLASSANSGEELETWCREAIGSNPKSLSDFKNGKDSAINGFKGHVMKAARGRASPQDVDRVLRGLLSKM
jgi:aspartyl-tRNA(Asn)/glutamyl-tRNA(Gln) amidotransferase subunit B